MGLLAFLVDAGIDGMNGFKFGAVRRAIADKGERGPQIGLRCAVLWHAVL